MNRLLVVGLVGLSVVLSGCGQKGGVGRLGAAALSQVAGVRAQPMVAQTPIDDRKLSVSLPAKRIKFAIYPVKADGDVTIWSAQDGSQLALRDSMVIWSRGFGMDLMSATAPGSAGVATEGNSHTRVYHTLDGAESPVRQQLACTVSRGPKDDPENGLRHMEEKCANDRLSVRNEFLVDGANRIVESRQWLSSGVGYIILSTDGG